MDIEKLNQYLEEYNLRFNEIWQKEIFKWKAIKCFQDNWNIDSEDFKDMLSKSFVLTKSLLKSQTYYPLKIIEDCAKVFTKNVRESFRNLFDENNDIFIRITDFQKELNLLNTKVNPDTKAFQDPRSINVYLTLRYPEGYFFYKYTDLVRCIKILKFSYKPIRGKFENVGYYQNMCENIRNLISKDSILIKKHFGRLGSDCYQDENLNILTQDFIHAITGRLNENQVAHVQELGKYFVEELFDYQIIINVNNVDFEGRFTNFIENNRQNKILGDLGEQWVIRYEKTKLKNAGLQDLANKIEHSSIIRGDGLGFDIKSFDLKKNPIFIEVKTTRGNKNSTFYISRNELERSKIKNDSFYLYRVYDYNENELETKLWYKKGDLTNICILPNEYKVTLKNNSLFCKINNDFIIFDI